MNNLLDQIETQHKAIDTELAGWPDEVASKIPGRHQCADPSERAAIVANNRSVAIGVAQRVRERDQQERRVKALRKQQATQGAAAVELRNMSERERIERGISSARGMAPGGVTDEDKARKLASGYSTF